jgi:hypothetical protein
MVLACGFLIWGADNYRRLAERLQKEEDLRKLVVEELAHRLKNKIATIQSIISYQLREQPGLRNDIVARLVALSATDDLIIASHGRGASIRDILSTELGPYELSRISLDGPDILLPPNTRVGDDAVSSRTCNERCQTWGPLLPRWKAFYLLVTFERKWST